MKDFNELPEVLKYFVIASAGGVLRYLSNFLSHKLTWNRREFIIWIILGGGIGVLSGLIVPLLIEDRNIQHAVIYTSGMISIEIIKIITHHGPNLLDKYLGKQGK